ncbi:MAG: nicotinate (nicotinamide) nucleotide adenylyltransferase [Chitinophagales bacterium]|nr:nicotinate-nucleotide adenylyltransferase [Bacteroidota bacterium]MCB9043386.1 nicotinate-nucleotide adenylyltransferase [Chitinophagales bacterium]
MIGLFFGSFNPVHIGHLIIAEYMATRHFEEVWLVVSPHNPHKNTGELLAESNRFSLVKKCLRGNSKLKAKDFEFYLEKPSYTYLSLAYLRQKYPAQTFSIIMGSDNLEKLHTWKNFAQIVSQYNIFVYPRLGYATHNEHLASFAENIQLTQAPILEISSTQIRYQLKNGLSIKYLVLPNIEKEIVKNNFYL